METYAKTSEKNHNFDTIRLFYSLCLYLSKSQLLDKLLFLVKAIVEYVFGMYAGFTIGRIIGLYVGHLYVEHFEPVYFNEYISQIYFWRSAPYMFVKYGAIIGLAIGIITVKIINNKLLNQRIISMYEKRIYNSYDIALCLDKSVGQIKDKINELARKGRINIDARSLQNKDKQTFDIHPANN